MTYLKIWTNFLDLIDALEYDEIGRLFEMMLVYAQSGTEPAAFEGNERFLWPVAKQQIDLAAEKNEKLRQNGMKGGRPKTTETKVNQTEPNESNEKQTKAYKEKKSNVKEYKEKNTVSPAFDAFWSEYPNKVKKPNALRAWEKLNPDAELVVRIMHGLARWKQSAQWAHDGGRYIPHPATWLNARQWEDEIQARIIPRSVAAQSYEQRDYSGVQDELMARQDAEMQAYMANERGTA